MMHMYDNISYIYIIFANYISIFLFIHRDNALHELLPLPTVLAVDHTLLDRRRNFYVTFLIFNKYLPQLTYRFI